MWAGCAHVGSIVAVLILTAVGIGFVGYAVPFVIYFMHRDKSTFVANHAKQMAGLAVIMLPVSIIFAIIIAATTIGSVVAGSASGLMGAGLVGLIYFVLAIAVLVFIGIASYNAFNGKEYRYPIIGNMVANIGNK